MDRICLSLPTNRECSATITAMGAEAAYAAQNFGVEVRLLILDSSDERTREAHARTVTALPEVPGVVVHHLDEAAQRDFLRRAVDGAALPEPDRVLDLMLPEKLSYGACTNRAFLLAAALGCRSVHRRDSDCDYQVFDGEPVYPIHHELASLSRPAAEASGQVTEVSLDPAIAHRPVSMVGARSSASSPSTSAASRSWTRRCTTRSWACGHPATGRPNRGVSWSRTPSRAPGCCPSRATARR